MSPKGSRTVWSGGKDEDNIKVLPIAIQLEALKILFKGCHANFNL